MLKSRSDNKLRGLSFLASATYNRYRYNPMSKRIISPYIKKADMGDGLLTPDFIDKEINVSRDTWVHVAIPFRSLAGKRDNDRALFLLGAIITPYDHLFDDINYSDEDLRAIVSSPFDYTPHNSIDNLALLIAKDFSDCFSTIRYQKLNELFYMQNEAQIKSKRQKSNEPLSHDFLYEVTYEKCGASGQIFWLCANGSMSQKERGAMYDVGAVVQMIDDLRDGARDSKEGIQTLVTNTTDPVDMSNIINDFMRKAFAGVKSLDVPEKNKQDFLFHLTSALIVGAARYFYNSGDGVKDRAAYYLKNVDQIRLDAFRNIDYTRR